MLGQNLNSGLIVIFNIPPNVLIVFYLQIVLERKRNMTLNHSINLARGNILYSTSQEDRVANHLQNRTNVLYRARVLRY